MHDTMKRIGLLTFSAFLAAGSVQIGLADEVDFKKDIAPLITENCLNCHGGEKTKGRYRVDTKESAFKGGSSGEVAIVPGKLDGSEFIRRITLPAGDDDLMPPEDGPLPEKSIALLKAWVEQGAKWPDSEVLKTVGAVEAEAAADSVASVPVRPVPPLPQLPDAFDGGEKEALAIAALSKQGIDVRPVAQNTPWKEVNLRLKGAEVTDSVVAHLKDIPSLIEVRLGNTKVSDAGLETLTHLPHLQVLGLELTGVTDAGLAHVAKLSNLVYLNLYGTKVSDAGLVHLGGLKHLRNLYLWQSQVTKDGATSLGATLPGCDINLGAELAAATVAAPKE